MDEYRGIFQPLAGDVSASSELGKPSDGLIINGWDTASTMTSRLVCCQTVSPRSQRRGSKRRAVSADAQVDGCVGKIAW